VKKSPSKTQIYISFRAPLLPLAVLFLSLAGGAKAASVVPPKLENLGFTLLQAKPIDFTLDAVKGAPVSLKDYRGKWVLLAFWATWCGPCNEEMPQLESLYRKFKKDGLSILGVSVDQDRAPVEKFQSEKEISFPLLLDSDSAVASKYLASALPTLYVISPDWKLAGVMRGARDWSSPETLKQVAALLGARNYDANAGIKMEEEGGTLSLPNHLAPPVLSLEGVPKQMTRGDSLNLAVAVTWKGNPKDYIIKVPKLTLPDGIRQGEVSSSSTSENESTTLRYHFPLKFEKEGSLKVGPVELAYSPRAGGKELFSRNEGVTVDVQKTDLARILLPLIFLLILLSAGTFWFLRRKKPKALSEKTGRSWSEPYEEIRQLKMNGKRNEYMIALLKLDLALEEEAGTKNRAAQSLLEKLQFGGAALSETEVMNIEKRVELAVRNQTLKAEEP
jgi:peroxiredoxin